MEQPSYMTVTRTSSSLVAGDFRTVVIDFSD